MAKDKVEQLMTRGVATCHPDEGLHEAARIMWEHDCGCVPVVVPDDGSLRVVGMITDRDVCMAAYTQGRPLYDIPIRSAMNRDVRSCGPRDSIATALRILATSQLHRLPILDEHEHLVGLLSLADVARERRRSPGLATDEDIAATLGGIDQPRGARTLMTAA